LDHRDLNVAALMQQLRTKRVAEAFNGMLGSAVCGLQRDASIRQRRANLDDDAVITGFHPPERREGAVDHAEVRHLGHALVLVHFHLDDRREDTRHRVVDPDVDGTKRLLEFRGGSLDAVRIRNVALEDQRAATCLFDVVGGTFEPRAATREQADRCTTLRVRPHDGAADAS
jgi:hypothetical protein